MKLHFLTQWISAVVLGLWLREISILFANSSLVSMQTTQSHSIRLIRWEKSEYRVEARENSLSNAIHVIHLLCITQNRIFLFDKQSWRCDFGNEFCYTLLVASRTTLTTLMCRAQTWWSTDVQASLKCIILGLQRMRKILLGSRPKDTQEVFLFGLSLRYLL